ncbi:MAG: 3'-5' exonuclease [Ruminococcus sp.]|nr:3'-5' exonuclease [Ruminococcus sp.]
MDFFIGVAVFFGVTFILLGLLFARIYFSNKRQERLKDELKRRLAEEKAQQEEQQRKQLEETKRRREAFLREKRSEFKAAVDSLPMYKITLTDNKHNRNQEIDIVDKQYKNITKASAVIKLKDFIAVDVETTGLKTGGNDIIQLSAIKYRDFKATEAFDAYIKPRKPIPKEATEINGITDEMVNDAPRFYQIIDCFNEFIEDLPLVAHNAPFDIKHLFVNGLDSVVDKTVYDTLELSRKAYKDEYSYKLTDICEANNIYPTSSHDSLYDSYAAGELFKCIVADLKEIDIDNLFDNE